MSKSLPARPNLEFLRKEAKDLHEAFTRGDPRALPVIRHLHYLNGIPDAELLIPGRVDVPLQRVQFCLAKEYGCADWEALKTRVEGDVVAAAPQATVAVDRAAVATAAREMFVARAGDQPISRRDTEALIAALCTLTAVGRRHGLVAFTTLADAHFDEEPARAGLSALEGGMSPGDVKALMAERRGPAIADYDRRQEVVIAGIIRIGAGYTPDAMRDSLLALPGSMAKGEPVAGFVDRPTGNADLDRELGRMPAWQRPTEELVPMFVALMAVAHRDGLIPLDGVGAGINDGLIQAGLQLVVDGTDNELVRGILEARRTALRAARERRWDMIALAVHEASQGTNQNLVAAWCRAMAGLRPAEVRPEADRRGMDAVGPRGRDSR
jgi:flagellar motor component MotA